MSDTMHHDGACPWLLCLVTEPHDHPVCATCGAVRYGNIFCDECKAKRPIIDAEITRTVDGITIERLRLALWSAMQRCSDCITSWTRQREAWCARCRESLDLVADIAAKESTL